MNRVARHQALPGVVGRDAILGVYGLGVMGRDVLDFCGT